MPRILVVDDSPTENFKISGVLKRHGHEVLAAESGEQALQVARDSQPDLILMDIVMPGLNGFQATRQLTRDPATSARRPTASGANARARAATWSSRWRIRCSSPRSRRCWPRPAAEARPRW